MKTVLQQILIRLSFGPRGIELLQQLLRLLNICVAIHSKYFETPGVKPIIRRLSGGKVGDAGNAPGGPEIEQDELCFDFRKLVGLAGEITVGEVWNFSPDD